MEEENEYQSANQETRRRNNNLCGCTNFRIGLFAAGAIELVLGTIGLGLILLGPQKRHIVLNPLEESHTVHVYSEQWEDTMQLLIEFWLPSLAYWVLGAVLIAASLTRRMSLLVFWVMISTLLLAGSVAAFLALVVAGASVIGLLPVILATILQIYFYVVISDVTYFHWRQVSPKRDDKEVLVNSTV